LTRFLCLLVFIAALPFIVAGFVWAWIADSFDLGKRAYEYLDRIAR
jgi:hypothetical protein